MHPTPAEALGELAGAEGGARRRFQELLAALFAGQVVRQPEAAAERLQSMYTFLDRHRPAVEAYVALAGFRLLVDEEYHFAFLAHPDASLRETLDKHTSRTAVACRLLYHRQQQTVHLSAGVRVAVLDLLETMDVAAGPERRTSRVRTAESLRTLARHGMVELPPRFQGFDDDEVRLTPVLPRRLPAHVVTEYLERTRPRRDAVPEGPPAHAIEPWAGAAGPDGDPPNA